MATLNLPSSLPLSLPSYINHARTPITPIIPVRGLKLLARWIPTASLQNAAIDTINLAGDLLAGNRLLRDEEEYQRWRIQRIKELLLAMDQATSLEDYEACTTELDYLQGHDEWKATFESIEPDYNPEAIRTQLQKLKQAANSGDATAILHLIRTSLTRDLGGMGMLRLYKHSWFGTKRLIGEYIETAVATIEKLQEITKLDSSTAKALYYQNSLEDALKYFGRSALTLSGGANLGMKHIGVAKALWEAELLPDIISGASAGSIVAAIVCSSTDKEMVKVLEHFPKSDLGVFDMPDLNGLSWMKERGYLFWKTRAFFAISNLQRVMRTWLGDLTFREAYNKTQRILNICISSADSSEARLLNYITAPDVYLWSAVCASCSVPFVFQPATIYEKNPKTGQPDVWMLHSQQWVDGSLDHDIPMRKLSEMFNVNFFIVSQVNPHVRVFLESEEEFKGIQPTSPTSSHSKLQVIMSMAREEMVYRAHMLSDLGFPRVLTRGASVFNQQYTGDINILPEIERHEYLSMMANPTPEFLLRSTVIGEKATWPKICRIKNSVAIEKALQRAISDFRERVNFGPEAVKARQPIESNRGRSRTGRGDRPSFLRRRSLSNEGGDLPRPGYGRGSGPPSPSPNRGVRRNMSSGSVMEHIWMRLTPLNTKPNILPPQAGISEELTTPTPLNPEESLSKPFKRQSVPSFKFTLGSESETEENDVDFNTKIFGSIPAELPTLSMPTSPIEAFKSFIGGRFGGSGDAT